MVCTPILSFGSSGRFMAALNLPVRRSSILGEVWRPAPPVNYHHPVATVIDIHAHYVPAALMSAARREGARLGVRLVEDAATPALHFDYGFKVRPFFPKLIEPVAH